MDDKVVRSDPVALAAREDGERSISIELGNQLGELPTKDGGALVVQGLPRDSLPGSQDRGQQLSENEKEDRAQTYENPGVIDYDYCKFLFNPDKCSPVRMPSKYAYPTVIFHAGETYTITLPAGDFAAYFAPQNPLIGDTPTNWSDFTIVRRTGTAVPMYSGLTWASISSGGPSYTVTGGATGCRHQDYFDSVRVIAAVVEISYVGSLTASQGQFVVSAIMKGSGSHVYGWSGDLVPTVQEQFVSRFNRKYAATEVVRCIWFPVDSTCSQFQKTLSVSASIAKMSQLVFIVQGLGFATNSPIDFRIKYYYEGTPNMVNSNLFSASQALAVSDWREQWNKVHTMAMSGDSILITGLK